MRQSRTIIRLKTIGARRSSVTNRIENSHGFHEVIVRTNLTHNKAAATGAVESLSYEYYLQVKKGIFGDATKP